MKDFKTLWVCYDANTSDKHQLFFKEHSVRNQEAEYPRDKTLFVLNVPPYATTDSLKRAFTKLCGNVHFVTFANAKGFKTAYVVFQRESSLDKAMELSSNCVITLNNDENVCLTGLKKWCQEYNDSVFDEEAMRIEIEEYINTYEKNKQELIEREKAEKERDDGWVTVTSGKKRGQFAPTRKESTIDKIQSKHKKEKQLLNFYTFQIRETKQQNLAEMRKKFELDKKKIEKLKLTRRFKPF